MFFFGKKRKPTLASAPEPVEQVVVEIPEAAPEEPAAIVADPRRRRRPGAGKTRLMGFDTSDGRVVDLFETEKVETAQEGRCLFPVGWVIVTSGPGRGECFAVKAGMSQIGRGEDQAVRLDFGDMAISRSNHAAIVYDFKTHSFLLGHGGKANLVRLNGKPVISTNDLKDGDSIEIGETRLQFKSLCSTGFNWDQTDEHGEDDDVEIA